MDRGRFYDGNLVVLGGDVDPSELIGKRTTYKDGEAGSIIKVEQIWPNVYRLEIKLDEGGFLIGNMKNFDVCPQAYQHSWDGTHYFYYHAQCVEHNPPEVTFERIPLSDVPDNIECDFCYQMIRQSKGEIA